MDVYCLSVYLIEHFPSVPERFELNSASYPSIGEAEEEKEEEEEAAPTSTREKTTSSSPWWKFSVRNLRLQKKGFPEKV